MKQKHIKSEPLGSADITGAGGKSGGTHQGQSLTDSLTTSGRIKAVAVLSAGPIEGLVNGEQSVFLDGTPYANADGSHNFEEVSWQVTQGAAD